MFDIILLAMRQAKKSDIVISTERSEWRNLKY